MTPHGRRVLKTVCASIFVLLLAGVTYQGVATALERRSFKYPGRMVPVGDHQLHITCIGAGTPTVVLEAPALGFSASWTLVQTTLAMATRVCAYDRAGLGWSEASDAPSDMRAVPADLHTLLEGAGERAPYVLVGDGLGAALVTEFAGQFPADTAGLVLIGSPIEPGVSAGGGLTVAPSPWLARIGILRLSRLLSSTPQTLPGPPGAAIDAFSTRPDHLTRGAQELRQRRAVIAEASAVALPPDMPVARVESPAEGALLSTVQGAGQVAAVVMRTVLDWRRATQ